MKQRTKLLLATLGVTITATITTIWTITPGGTAVYETGDYVVYTFSVPYNDSHFLVVDNKTFLIDTGMEEDATALDKSIRQSGFDPANISAIIMTHGHADHAGGTAYFQAEYDIPVIAGLADQGMFATGMNDEICPTDFMAKMRVKSDQALTFPPFTPDVLVSAPLNLTNQFGIDMTLTPLPGHTEGSLILTFRDLAFIGDLFRGSMISNRVVQHFYMCDLEDNQRDVKTLLTDIAPEAEQFFTGHFSRVDRNSVEDFLR